VQIYKPGQLAQVGGLYLVIDRRGRLTGNKRLVVTGGRFPPTRVRGHRYVLLGMRVAADEALRSHRELYEAHAEDFHREAAGGR
jgi:hypothetical protein